ncbi:MAG: hypothetical protein J7452_04070 [Thermoflexus sp.]|nr:hypothetical protein [Thermoflexus sp.]
MDSALISKIEKARRYAEERDRFRFLSFSVVVRGENGTHHVCYHEGNWSCDCDFFRRRGTCAHIMALERVLEGML